MKRAGASEDDLLLMYNASIRSLISYAAPVWFPGLTNDLMETLERLQKRAMKIIYGYAINYDTLSEKRIRSLNSYLESLCIKYVKQICDNAEHPLRKILLKLELNHIIHVINIIM